MTLSQGFVDFVPKIVYVQSFVTEVMWREIQFTLIMKFECIGFSSFLHKLCSCLNSEYVYKCTILYIEKLIFNTVLFAVIDILNSDSAERG